jgi:hypothetical protein
MEQGAVLEGKGPVLGAIDLGSGEIGRQQVRGELDAVEIPLQPAPKTLTARVLASPGAPSTSRCPSASNAMSRRSSRAS